MQRSGRIRLIQMAVCLLCCLCLAGCVRAEVPEGVQVPILLYHHFSEQGSGVTPETFELHMRTLAEAGYTAVTFDQLVNYVQGNCRSVRSVLRWMTAISATTRSPGRFWSATV